MDTLKKLIDKSSFEKINISELLDIITKIGNTYIDVQEEVQDWNCTVQFDLLDDNPFWIEINDTNFSYGFGTSSKARLSINITKEKCIKMFLCLNDTKKEVRDGIFPFKGDLADLAQFGYAIEIIFEELEELLKSV